MLSPTRAKMEQNGTKVHHRRGKSRRSPGVLFRVCFAVVLALTGIVINAPSGGQS
jgi:hypothetical protein